MEAAQIVIEPQVLCPCGKSILPMNEEQRANYEEAIRKIQEARSQATEEAGEGEETSANTTECQ